jgi:hypothetical protein
MRYESDRVRSARQHISRALIGSAGGRPAQPDEDEEDRDCALPVLSTAGVQ